MPLSQQDLQILSAWMAASPGRLTCPDCGPKQAQDFSAPGVFAIPEATSAPLASVHQRVVPIICKGCGLTRLYSPSAIGLKGP